ncbi:hypothetical protein [Desulfosarcina variabilis]
MKRLTNAVLPCRMPFTVILKKNNWFDFKKKRQWWGAEPFFLS